MSQTPSSTAFELGVEAALDILKDNPKVRYDFNLSAEGEPLLEQPDASLLLLNAMKAKLGADAALKDAFEEVLNRAFEDFGRSLEINPATSDKGRNAVIHATF